jgi:ABC-type multidrug transport system fused ATPase/permease subunit
MDKDTTPDSADIMEEKREKAVGSGSSDDSLRGSRAEAVVMNGDEDVEALQHIKSEISNRIGFREVDEVDVKVRNLVVKVNTSLPAYQTLFKKKDPDAVNEKIILNDVSADMRAGTLTAIIGGSGSGKVSSRSCYPSRFCYSMEETD